MPSQLFTPALYPDPGLSERCIYFGVPLNLEKIDATWVRALAFEEK